MVPMFENGTFIKILACWKIPFVFLWVILTLSSPQVAGFPRIPSLVPAPTTATFHDQAVAEESEANALLKWKHSLENQSQTLLPTWTGTTSPCKWEGIQCDKSESVSSINLENYLLKGTLQTLSFSSLPNLLRLNICNNSFYGTIPPQIGNMSKVIDLNLSTNTFHGSIPKEIWTLRSLRGLDLSICQLSGAIPNSIANLTNLSYLDLGTNNISGSIPPEIGKLNNLKHLSISDNNLFGSIPQEIGVLTKLRYIDLYSNNLSGPIPTSIENLSNLEDLELDGNQLSGSIPYTIGNLTKLTMLSLSYNDLSGSIPPSIGNLINLVSLDLHANNLSGSIPTTIGNLISLTWLGLSVNKLNGSIPQVMNNITNLNSLFLDNNDFTGHLPPLICFGGSLEYFTAQFNRLTGPIPRNLKSSSSIAQLALQGNQLQGDLEQDFGVYPNLNYIDLSDNKFYGHISPNWGKCPNLITFKISNNNISGGIPVQLVGASNLGSLHLSSNHLVGEIPKELGNLKDLVELYISNNHFSGNIPTEIGLLQNLLELDLAGNQLNGTIPKEVVSFPKLVKLNLSNNKITGSIPFEFGKSQSLDTLDLSRNLLSGIIPTVLGGMIHLQWLDLSHNNLHGAIPSSFDDMPGLISVNISYNQLEGPLPKNQAFLNAPIESLKNNKGLCGNVSGLVLCPTYHSRKSHKVILQVLFIILGALILVLCGVGVSICILCRRARNKEIQTKEAQSEEFFSIWSHDGKMVFENIIGATNNFDDKYLIGKGGQGYVYKAELPSGLVVAVKKIHSETNGEKPNFKAFENEIQALTEIRHRNIIKLYGFCSHSRFSFLVYKFLEGGSLDQILNNDTLAIAFDWEKRVNVVKGVANALSYMHHDCSPPIIHRDISSKNVLLDLEYEAHVSDFGTAKFLKPDSQSWTTCAYTLGYAAPELAQTMKMNEKCDVFSFGVLSLEILMGKHPGDLISSLSSSSTTSMSYDLLLIDVLDERPHQPVKPIVGDVILIARLAFSCLNENPSSRPTMDQVSKELAMRKSPLEDQFPLIKLGQLQ
ncbi:MDIS1-interacting receptor like kinase 2-like [Gastrolobium bilobum]|uniref:MDIS1-interacting receptor like kinase 2-like n=1 Tax=Gastrolobium bilobum TaxID=150636 RepID=UPI002AB17709|nr:MDIS1-interacting receptor like kinase 2-like [Gastrolobium bilobum]